jgi:hypothetical protein
MPTAIPLRGSQAISFLRFARALLFPQPRLLPDISTAAILAMLETVPSSSSRIAHVQLRAPLAKDFFAVVACGCT